MSLADFPPLPSHGLIAVQEHKGAIVYGSLAESTRLQETKASTTLWAQNLSREIVSDFSFEITQ